jgi:acyl-CoA synthetase (NDP forming)
MENLDFIFKPNSVAIIGASNTPGKWGNFVLEHVISSGFPGQLYPVNPSEKEVLGTRCFETVMDVPGSIDLAVITVPASAVISALLDCGHKRIRGCLIISAGFAEHSSEGKILQEKVRQIGLEHGIRTVGPNSNGIWSFPGRLNIAFDNPPKQGPIAFLSQSGNFGVALANMAARKGYGVNYFVHLGNQVDLSFSEYLDYLCEEDSIRAIICYMEGVTNGRRFFESASRVTRKKPVIVFKGGISPQGKRAIQSHTASLSENNEIFEGMCRQAGIIQAREPFRSFEMAYALAGQPCAQGRSVAIVSGGGGFCVTATDACHEMGLEIPPIDAETQRAIGKIASPVAPNPINPIDLAGDMRPWVYSRVIEIVGNLDYIHGILATTPFWMPIQYRSVGSIETLIGAIKLLLDTLHKIKKPLIVVQTYDLTNNPLPGLFHKARIPMYESPHVAVQAMQALFMHGTVLKDRSGSAGWGTAKEA